MQFHPKLQPYRRVWRFGSSSSIDYNLRSMVELSGNLHMHTPYSDGEKYHADIADDAIEAGLDFIVVTDHNIWVEGVEGVYENGNGRVLLLTGEEVHNVRRQPQASHFLAFGAETELSTYAANPQELINQTLKAGGIGFLAHPHERDLQFPGGGNLGWHDWDIEGYTGLEIWNYMSSFKSRVADAIEKSGWKNDLMKRVTAVRLALNPEKAITTPEPETLALWDKLLAQGKHIAAIGNSDAHGIEMRFGPIVREIFPYEFLFRAVNTHILLPKPLTGHLETDKRSIYRAVERGNGWVGYDMIHPTKGFRFIGKGNKKGSMGDEIKLRMGATLQVTTPTKANIRLIRHGELVASAERATHLLHIPTTPGAYRVECLLSHLGQERGWIYSNPIYLY